MASTRHFNSTRSYLAASYCFSPRTSKSKPSHSHGNEKSLRSRINWTHTPCMIVFWEVNFILVYKLSDPDTSECKKLDLDPWLKQGSGVRGESIKAV